MLVYWYIGTLLHCMEAGAMYLQILGADVLSLDLVSCPADADARRREPTTFGNFKSSASSYYD